ncbi:MAG: hypothetical protein IJ997_01710 [Mycoplasmataceae bacterium]|nr:hypothetical protein [Mycoplasmataceae bacterium]
MFYFVNKEMKIIDIYDKYNDYFNQIDIVYYNYRDPLHFPMFIKILNNMSINIYNKDKIISSKNNYFNIPYAYLLNNVIRSNDKHKILFSVPFNVDKYEMKLLTKENDKIIPVYEYIINSITEVEYHYNKKKYELETYMIYYNRFYTYKVKVIAKNFNIYTEVVDVINYGTDWLMNKLTKYILENSDIPKDKWDYIIEQNYLIYSFLEYDFEDNEYFIFEWDDEDLNDYETEIKINMNTFKSEISDYLSFFEGCTVKTLDMFTEKIFNKYYNYGSIKLYNIIDDVIAKSLTCDIIYYIYNRDINKIMGIKNKSITGKLNHCYIRNEIISNDNSNIKKVEFVNTYQQKLEKALSIIRKNNQINSVFDSIIINNKGILNIMFFEELKNIINEKYKAFPNASEYMQLSDYLINNYKQYVNDYNYLFKQDNITIKYNDTTPIILSNNTYEFNIPEYIIECKNNFDYVKKYGENVIIAESEINDNLEILERIKERRREENRRNLIIDDVLLIKNDEVKKYLYTKYNDYIEKLRFILSCNNVYYEYNDNSVRVICNYNDKKYNITDDNKMDYFGNKYKVIPCYYYSDTINENYIYEYIIDAFSYFYENPFADNIDLVYKDYKITAIKQNNIITFKNLIKSHNIHLSNINRLYKEFNNNFFKMAFPKKYSNEHVIIGSGETHLVQGKQYKYIFVNKI